MLSQNTSRTSVASSAVLSQVAGRRASAFDKRPSRKAASVGHALPHASVSSIACPKQIDRRLEFVRANHSSYNCPFEHKSLPTIRRGTMAKEKPPHDIQQKLHALEEELSGLDPKQDMTRTQCRTTIWSISHVCSALFLATAGACSSNSVDLPSGSPASVAEAATVLNLATFPHVKEPKVPSSRPWPGFRTTSLGLSRTCLSFNASNSWTKGGKNCPAGLSATKRAAPRSPEMVSRCR